MKWIGKKLKWLWGKMKKIKLWYLILPVVIVAALYVLRWIRGASLWKMAKQIISPESKTEIRLPRKTKEQLETERERIEDHRETTHTDIDARYDSIDDAIRKKFGGGS